MPNGAWFLTLLIVLIVVGALVYIVDDEDVDRWAAHVNTGYALRGNSATTCAPSPGVDSIVQRPPTSAARSCMPIRP